MLRWIIGSSLRLRLVVVPRCAVLILCGATGSHRTPVDVFPASPGT
jgi:Cu/Ag efflux pump CusA